LRFYFEFSGRSSVAGIERKTQKSRKSLNGYIGFKHWLGAANTTKEMKPMLKRISVAALIFFATALCSAKGLGDETAKLPILCYHHVIPAADNKTYQENGLVMSKELFLKHMEYLYENGYHVITLEELKNFIFNKIPLPPKSVMVTFDDGYLSNYKFAYPILKQFNYKALLFIISGGIGVEDQPYRHDNLDMLSWLQVAASTDVFTYGSHTNALHYATDGVTGLIKASQEAADADLKMSLKHVQDRTIFAYPQGRYNKGIIQVLENNGIELAFTINPGYVTMDSNPMLLNRITIYSDFSVKLLEKIVSGKYKWR
jgi:peptidoglycan/xylan/chitin deacetylase (PgdA/CDA1 family)